MQFLLKIKHLHYVPVKEKHNLKKDSSSKFTERKRNFGKSTQINKKPEKKHSEVI